MTPSLSETLEPPSTTTYGRSGSSVSARAPRSRQRPARRRRAAAAGRRRRRWRACGARRRTRRRRTRRRARPAASAKAPRSASSLLVSPGLNRRFSSSATSPSLEAGDARLRVSPTVSVAKATGLPSSSPSRWATGRQAVLRAPARPWAGRGGRSTMTRAPASTRASRVGSAGPDPAVVGDASSPSQRDVEVAADEDALAGERRTRSSRVRSRAL